MSKHDYTLKAPEGTGFDIQVSPSTLYGYFEHNTLGDGCGGGLWFERIEDGTTSAMRLTDYDGVFELPKKVAVALVGMGINVDDMVDEPIPVDPAAAEALSKTLRQGMS